jgi:2-methylisocitrate lyase-like PEP mutase family enzyme
VARLTAISDGRATPGSTGLPWTRGPAAEVGDSGERQRAATARLADDAGAAAVATTSAGVAWSLGAPDGDHLGRDLAAGLVARIVAAVSVPVTADIEGGYAPDPAGVAETVRAIVDAGASGINIEDAGGAGLRPVDEQADRIAAAREAATTAGIPLFVNARTDTYLRAVGDPATRLAATLDRAAAYLAAGADGIFVPGVADPETVAALAAGIEAPLNIMAGPGSPTVADLAKLGVARVSVGAAIALSPTPGAASARCSPPARTSRWRAATWTTAG